MIKSQYIKTDIILNKIKELEEARYYADVEQYSILDSKIEILQEILKPQ